MHISRENNEILTVPSWQPASKSSWGAEGDHSTVRGMLLNIKKINSDCE